MEPEQSPEQRRFAALGRLDALRDDLHDLYAGRGRWELTPEGANARTRNELRTRLDEAQRRAAHPNTRRRDRRTALREAETFAPVLDAAEARWQAVGQSAADDLQRAIISVEIDIESDDLAQRRQYLASLLDHRPPGFVVEGSPVVHPETPRLGLGR